MKSLCISFLAIAFLLFSCTSSNKKSKGTSEKLPPATFLEKLKSVENAQLIDVRTKEEVGGGSIQGAANMDFHSEVFSQMLSHLDQEAPVFV